MLSLCMCKCISTLIPLVLRHDIAEILLKLAVNTNQSQWVQQQKALIQITQVN